MMRSATLIFQRQEKVVEDIKKSMQEEGFHKEEPIVIAKLTDGTTLGVADGNTRLMVAKEIGMDEVPVVYKTFDSLEDAIQYAKDRQFHRRNLSQLHEGKSVEEIENDDLFSDFTFSEIAPKFEVPTETIELLEKFNN